MFEDVLYPDNEERYDRAKQLESDCSTYIYDLAQSKESIETSLLNAKAALQNAYKHFANKDIPLVPTNLAIGENTLTNWMLEIPVLTVSIFTGKMAAIGLEKASVAWLAKSGRIGEAAFTKLVGLPKWFNVGKIFGSMAAAAVATVALDVIIGAFTGAERRDNLRNSIRECIQPRFELKKACLINEVVKRTLDTIIISFETMTATLSELPEASLDAILNGLIAKNAHALDVITDDYVREKLAEFDRARGAWTNEDN